jgi:hypothetical protein
MYTSAFTPSLFPQNPCTFGLEIQASQIHCPSNAYPSNAFLRKVDTMNSTGTSVPSIRTYYLIRRTLNPKSQKYHPLPNDIIPFRRRWTHRSLINRITSSLRLITALRLLQLNPILLASIPISTSMVSIITLITVESIPRRLISDRWRIWRSRTAIVWLVGIVAIRVAVMLSLRRLAGEPACTVHGSHSTTSSAAVVEASGEERLVI